MKNSTTTKTANALLDIDAVTTNFHNLYLYTFASGVKGPMYCDNRRLLSYPLQRKIIVNEFLKVTRKLKFDIIGGVSTGGIPWATLLAEKLGKPMIYIRPKPKAYGKKRQIEGDLKKGIRVLLIEDLVSTGGSAISAIKAIRKNGGSVSDCIFIFTYELENSKRNFKKIRCRIHPLLTFHDLIQIALKRGYMNKKEYDELLKWNKNPTRYRASDNL